MRTLTPLTRCLFIVLLLSLATGFTACTKDAGVAPSSTGAVDDNGGGRNGNDDGPGDDNGGDN